jgi:hypothetical protein
MTIDADSTIIGVHGYHKQGGSYGYTHTLGYHPLLATRAGTSETLHNGQRLHKDGLSRSPDPGMLWPNGRTGASTVSAPSDLKVGADPFPA